MLLGMMLGQPVSLLVRSVWLFSLSGTEKKNNFFLNLADLQHCTWKQQRGSFEFILSQSADSMKGSCFCAGMQLSLV